MDTKKMKKIQLHLHLDGSVREKTISEILGYNVCLKAKDKCIDLNEYLEKFNIIIDTLQTKEILKRVTKELIEDLIEDNIIYAEIRFAPLLHTKKGLSINEVIETVLENLKNDNIKTTLILCMMRNHSFDENLKVIESALKYHLPLDLAGAEAIYKTKDFEKLFLIAKEKKLNYTIHAGEADGIESIKSAIDFATKRIGHGIRIIEDNNLIKEAIEKNITLELCPTSNIQTNAVDIYTNHPIKKLIDKGLRVTVSTDNNTVSNITLSEEYQKLVDNFNFTKKEFYNININAIDAAFTSLEEKELLKEEIKQDYLK